MGLVLYKPKIEDLWFREKMLSDPATMSYNEKWGGPISFPDEKWSAWYGTWIGNGDPDRYYRYLFEDETDQFVGEVSYHFDENGRCFCDVIVFAEYRGQGYGGTGLDMICDVARNRSIEIIYDEIAEGNPSLAMFLSHGFEEIEKTENGTLVRKFLTGCDDGGD